MSDTYHVIPENDFVEHSTDPNKPCLCKASAEWVQGGIIISHNSWDGRELYERAVDAGTLEPYVAADIAATASMMKNKHLNRFAE